MPRVKDNKKNFLKRFIPATPTGVGSTPDKPDFIAGFFFSPRSTEADRITDYKRTIALIMLWQF